VENVVELAPRIDRPYRNLVVIQGKVFARNTYGNVGVYDLKTGQKISEIHIPNRNLGDIATDGKSLFFHLRGNFDLKDTDILLAMMIEKDTTSVTGYVGRETDTREEKEDIMEFINKPLSDLPKPMKGEASENGIQSRIVSIPLDMIEESKAYNMQIPDSRQRFLVGAQADLHSHEKFEYIFVSYSFFAHHEKYSGIANGKASNWNALQLKAVREDVGEKIGLKIPGNIVFVVRSIHGKDIVYPVWIDARHEMGQNYGREFSLQPGAAWSCQQDEKVDAREEFNKHVKACYQNDDKLYFLRGKSPFAKPIGVSNISPTELVICNLKWKDREKGK